MNILDENIPDHQRRWLQSKRIHVHQVGHEIGRNGMKDDAIIPLLLQLDRPTFFTLDVDFYNRRCCHERYCLVHLDVKEELIADYSRRLLRHRALNSKAKRMGRVIQVKPSGLALWSKSDEKEVYLSWK